MSPAPAEILGVAFLPPPQIPQLGKLAELPDAGAVYLLFWTALASCAKEVKVGMHFEICVRFHPWF